MPLLMQQRHAGVQSGEVQGSTTAVQLPNIPGTLFWITAMTSNTGDVYLGGPGVTVPNGTTDLTSGIELNPGDQIGPLPLDNLNRLYMICDGAGDDITYLAVG